VTTYTVFLITLYSDGLITFADKNSILNTKKCFYVPVTRHSFLHNHYMTAIVLSLDRCCGQMLASISSRIASDICMTINELFVFS